MRLLLLILIAGLLHAQDWAARMDSLVALEWQSMSQAQRGVVWYAYDWGAERNFREMGAIYAVESKGEMSVVRKEFNGGESVGPGQNLVRYAALRTYGGGYSPSQYKALKHRLTTDLDYSLVQSYEHIKVGLMKFDTRWEVWKYYNGINAPHERYPARVQAWLKFLDEKQRVKFLRTVRR